MQELITSLFSINSIWFFVLQAVVWLGLCLVIIMTMDTAHPQQSYGKLKSNLGYFFAFMVLSIGLIYMVFGRAPMV